MIWYLFISTLKSDLTTSHSGLYITSETILSFTESYNPITSNYIWLDKSYLWPVPWWKFYNFTLKTRHTKYGIANIVYLIWSDRTEWFHILMHWEFNDIMQRLTLSQKGPLLKQLFHKTVICLSEVPRSEHQDICHANRCLYDVMKWSTLSVP